MEHLRLVRETCRDVCIEHSIEVNAHSEHLSELCQNIRQLAQAFASSSTMQQTSTATDANVTSGGQGAEDPLDLPKPLLRYPLKFDSRAQELNFDIMRCLFESLGHKHADEKYFRGAFALYISGNKLDADGLQHLEMSTVSEVFDLPLLDDTAIDRPMPGVELLGKHPMAAVAERISSAAKQLSEGLRAQNMSSMAEFVLSSLSAHRQDSPEAKFSALLASLTTTFPVYRSRVEKGSWRLDLCLPVQHLAVFLEAKYGASDELFRFDSLRHLTCVPDEEVELALNVLRVIETTTETPTIARQAAVVCGCAAVAKRLKETLPDEMAGRACERVVDRLLRRHSRASDRPKDVHASSSDASS